MSATPHVRVGEGISAKIWAMPWPAISAFSPRLDVKRSALGALSTVPPQVVESRRHVVSTDGTHSPTAFETLIGGDEVLTLDSQIKSYGQNVRMCPPREILSGIARLVVCIRPSVLPTSTRSGVSLGVKPASSCEPRQTSQLDLRAGRSVNRIWRDDTQAVFQPNPNKTTVMNRPGQSAKEKLLWERRVHLRTVGVQTRTMPRLLFLMLSIVLAACSKGSPPPPPPQPRPVGTIRPSAPSPNAEVGAFPEHFTIVFTREYGMWKYRTCTLEVSLFLNTDRAAIECVTTDDKHEKFSTNLRGFDETRLRQLAEAADLYTSDHVGEDLTPTDGMFDTLRFRPVSGGRAVVLVTSRNRSFEDHEMRREVLQLLNQIRSDLREKAKLAVPGHHPDFQ
jgi:hypothetical protein